MLKFTIRRPRSANYTPRDLILEATKNLPAWRDFDVHGCLRIRGADGNLYQYDHWSIDHIDESTDKVTVFLSPIDPRTVPVAQ